MRILIVDDDRSFCQFLAELLEEKGHETSWTTHSLQAYKMSLRQLYDLLVLDVRMSPLPGTELAVGLKELNPGSKIILISAFADAELQNKARSIGVPLLSKPFTADKFFSLVGQVAVQ
jgi:DNA-binding response OmpR family regulator